MSKRFSAKDLESAISKPKINPNQGFKSGSGNNDDKTPCRSEPLGTLKSPKGKKKTTYKNKFNDDGTLEQKYSIKKNEQEAKLISTVGPHQKRAAQEIELINVECIKCGDSFEVNPALVSTSYFRCNNCCSPDAKQKNRRKQRE